MIQAMKYTMKSNRSSGTGFMRIFLVCGALWFSSVARADDLTVACYYFGDCHPSDARNTKLKGSDWIEWELVKAAKPRFPGHAQPKVPLWGYTDESDMKVMARNIAAAADHGIDAFIFDWHYDNDGPFLERPIDIGCFPATNNHRIKFAFMWANHDWVDIHPAKRGIPERVLYPGAATVTNIANIGAHLIQKYFAHPSCWRIKCKSYLSFYDLSKLVEGFGSVTATRAGLDAWRARARSAGLLGLHLNAAVWGRTILPGEKLPANPVQLVSDLGFDSITSYVWIHHVPLPELQTDYNFVRDAYFKYWDKTLEKFRVAILPQRDHGLGPESARASGRCFGNFGYAFMNTISGNTPGRFKEALKQTRERLLARPDGPRILNINCGNAWTEGSCLEPDTVHGMQYLEAVVGLYADALKSE